MGGSHGFASIAIAEAFPALNFVVQDLPLVVSSRSRTLTSSLESRITFMPHDFFTPQPVLHADVYFFRWIFHNWSDSYSIRILRNLIPALKPGARIVINDNVLPQPGTLAHWKEERIRSMDLTMLELQNARERELKDWEALFKEADERFEWNGGKRPEGSTLWILEAVWRG